MGLSLQFGLLLTAGTFSTPAEAFWRFIAFFTVLTNLGVAGVMTMSALAPASRIGRVADEANVRAALLLYILVVGIVYHLLLAGTWDPQGWQYVADLILHTGVPVLVLVEWLALARKDGLTFQRLPCYLVYPVVYAFYAMVRGAVDGFYPYPFVDATQLGYPRVLLNIAGLAAAFTLGSVLVIWSGRRMADSPRSVPE